LLIDKKKMPGTPSLAHRFVAGFLLLSATKGADRGSEVQKASHNEAVELIVFVA
jgi:hypothetical protein